MNAKPTAERLPEMTKKSIILVPESVKDRQKHAQEHSSTAQCMEVMTQMTNADKHA
jgi:hypothetical protein